MSGEPPAPSLDIVIVNWNAGIELRACLRSIADVAHEGCRLRRVVIIDNDSTDGSCDNLDQLPLPLHLIRNSTNRGFAAACNQGAKGTSADYLLFLNPDTRLFPDSLSRPVAFMQEPQNVEVGICGVRLIDGLGRTAVSCARFPTLGILVGKMTGLSLLWPTMFRPHLISGAECERTGYVDQIMGAFFLVRRAVFEELGGFDERFFVFFEEVDFSLRACHQGFRSVLLADVTAYHRGGLSSAQVRATRLFYSLRSRLLYGFKHYSLVEAVLLVVATMGLEFPLRLARAAGRGAAGEIGETVVAYGRLVSFCTRQGLALVSGHGGRHGAEGRARR